MQATNLLADLRKRHAAPVSLVKDILAVLEVLLPRNHKLPRTWYMLQKFMQRPLRDDLNQRTMKTYHLCRNEHCTHYYLEYPGRPQDVWPVKGCKMPHEAQTRRFKYFPSFTRTPAPLCHHCS